MANKRVLVIDDEPAIREVIQTALELEGYDVSSAENGQIGLDLIKSKGTPGLVVLDLMMPVMNGWKFIETVKNNSTYKDIPIVVTSAFAERELEHSVAKILQKPFDMKSLLEIVRKYCG